MALDIKAEAPLSATPEILKEKIQNLSIESPASVETKIKEAFGSDVKVTLITPQDSEIDPDLAKGHLAYNINGQVYNLINNQLVPVARSPSAEATIPETSRPELVTLPSGQPAAAVSEIASAKAVEAQAQATATGVLNGKVDAWARLNEELVATNNWVVRGGVVDADKNMQHSPSVMTSGAKGEINASISDVWVDNGRWGLVSSVSKPSSGIVYNAQAVGNLFPNPDATRPAIASKTPGKPDEGPQSTFNIAKNLTTYDANNVNFGAGSQLYLAFATDKDGTNPRMVSTFGALNTIVETPQDFIKLGDREVRATMVTMKHDAQGVLVPDYSNYIAGTQGQIRNQTSIDLQATQDLSGGRGVLRGYVSGTLRGVHQLTDDVKDTWSFMPGQSTVNAKLVSGNRQEVVASITKLYGTSNGWGFIADSSVVYNGQALGNLVPKSNPTQPSVGSAPGTPDQGPQNTHNIGKNLTQYDANNVKLGEGSQLYLAFATENDGSNPRLISTFGAFNTELYLPQDFIQLGDREARAFQVTMKHDANNVLVPDYTNYIAGTQGQIRNQADINLQATQDLSGGKGVLNGQVSGHMKAVTQLTDDVKDTWSFMPGQSTISAKLLSGSKREVVGSITKLYGDSNSWGFIADSNIVYNGQSIGNLFPKPNPTQPSVGSAPGKIDEGPTNTHNIAKNLTAYDSANVKLGEGSQLYLAFATNQDGTNPRLVSTLGALNTIVETPKNFIQLGDREVRATMVTMKHDAQGVLVPDYSNYIAGTQGQIRNQADINLQATQDLSGGKGVLKGQVLGSMTAIHQLTDDAKDTWSFMPGQSAVNAKLVSGNRQEVVASITKLYGTSNSWGFIADK
ncbi:MAG: hypothetical protein PHO03_06735, partial [Candidatus Omnitrophica bacterium]|nr:hypothetical protein [Candidatus Omnitrophota bacterium]